MVPIGPVAVVSERQIKTFKFMDEYTDDRCQMMAIPHMTLCRYDNVTLSPLVLGEGYDSVPFNVMELIKIFVP